MHKIVAIVFSISNEELTLTAWDDAGEEVELSFPLTYLLDFLEMVGCIAEEK